MSDAPVADPPPTRAAPDPQVEQPERAPTTDGLTGMVLTGGVDESAVAARVQALLPRVRRWEVVAVVPPPPDEESGQTGFASPVLTPQEARELADRRHVDAIGAAAATARGFGAVPAPQTVVVGGTDAVIDHVVGRRPDVVVVPHRGTGVPNDEPNDDTSVGPRDGDALGSQALTVLAGALPAPVLLIDAAPEASAAGPAEREHRTK